MFHIFWTVCFGDPCHRISFFTFQCPLYISLLTGGSPASRTEWWQWVETLVSGPQCSNVQVIANLWAKSIAILPFVIYPLAGLLTAGVIRISGLGKYLRLLRADKNIIAGGGLMRGCWGKNAPWCLETKLTLIYFKIN